MLREDTSDEAPLKRILTFWAALGLLLLPAPLAREGDGTQARLGGAPAHRENPEARATRNGSSRGTLGLDADFEREVAVLLEALRSAPPGVRGPGAKEPGGALPTPTSPRRLALLEAGGVLRPGLTSRVVGGVRHTPYQLYKRGIPVLNRRWRLREGASTARVLERLFEIDA